MTFLTEIGKPILKFIWNLKGSQIAKTMLPKKNKVEGLTLPDFKTYYKAAIIKTVWYQYNDKPIQQKRESGSKPSYIQPNDF